jgi:hypothetical protein
MTAIMELLFEMIPPSCEPMSSALAVGHVLVDLEGQVY